MDSLLRITIFFSSYWFFQGIGTFRRYSIYPCLTLRSSWSVGQMVRWSVSIGTWMASFPTHILPTMTDFVSTILKISHEKFEKKYDRVAKGSERAPVYQPPNLFPVPASTLTLCSMLLLLLLEEEVKWYVERAGWWISGSSHFLILFTLLTVACLLIYDKALDSVHTIEPHFFIMIYTNYRF